MSRQQNIQHITRYDDAEEVNEERFNKYINLGISADDMFIRLGGSIDERDLRCFKYPDVHELMKLGYRSVCLGSYIPWDVKMQVAKIKEELNWKGDQVEGVPPEYNYEKIECWMQGVRDYIKYLKEVTVDLRICLLLILEMEGLMLKMRKQILKLTKDGVQRA